MTRPTFTNDDLAVLGYTVRHHSACPHLPPPRKGWTPNALVTLYPDGGYAVTDCGIEGNAWAVAAAHYRRGLIKA